MEAFGFEQAQKEYTLQSFGEMADQVRILIELELGMAIRLFFLRILMKDPPPSQKSGLICGFLDFCGLQILAKF